MGPPSPIRRGQRRRRGRRQRQGPEPTSQPMGQLRCCRMSKTDGGCFGQFAGRPRGPPRVRRRVPMEASNEMGHGTRADHQMQRLQRKKRAKSPERDLKRVTLFAQPRPDRPWTYHSGNLRTHSNFNTSYTALLILNYTVQKVVCWVESPQVGRVPLRCPAKRVSNWSGPHVVGSLQRWHLAAENGQLAHTPPPLHCPILPATSVLCTVQLCSESLPPSSPWPSPPSPRPGGTPHTTHHTPHHTTPPATDNSAPMPLCASLPGISHIRPVPLAAARTRLL